MRGTRWSVSVGVLSLVTLAAMLAPASGASASLATAKITTTTIRPGVTLEVIDDPQGPWSIRVLTIDPAQGVTLDEVTTGSIGAFAGTSEIGAAHNAIAAINGDFSIDPGRPLHPFADDGTLKQSGVSGTGFAVSQDRTAAFFGNDHLTMTGVNHTTKKTFSVAEWNTGTPGPGEIAGFTTYGGRYEKPRSGGCYARLKVWSKLHWGQSQVGVYRDYTVINRRCGNPYSVKSGTVVLQSHRGGAGAAAVNGMKNGEKVRLGWSLGWSGVLGSISGMPLLVNQGINLAPPNSCHSYFCSSNPRTGIAQTADGKLMLVTVDGRNPGTSVGLTLFGFAKYLISLGAVTAVNLDGGGGTTMWVNGQGIVNSPSDPWGERPVTSAVLVVASDPAEPALLPFSASRTMFGPATGPGAPVTTVSSALARRAASLDASDPASTGGLMQWLSSQTSG